MKNREKKRCIPFSIIVERTGELQLAFHIAANPLFLPLISSIIGIQMSGMPPPERRGRPYRVYAAFFAAGILAFLAVNQWILPGARSWRDAFGSGTRSFDRNIARDSTAIFGANDALYSYVKKFGPKDTVLRLHELGYTSGYGDCHQPAHEAGRFSYEVYGEKAFQLCSAECHSGCYHGATEAYFKENGTANLEGNLKTLCSGELNNFFSHQCIHGIGHGLMAWTDYELFDALESCDLLPARQDSCWTGVFMENIVGGLAKANLGENSGAGASHFTEFLSDDPHYPCSDPELGEKYRSSCYFLQTSRMVQLFGGDFKKVADSCAKVPSMYQRTCFESMGRDVGGTFRRNPAGAIAACGNAPKGEMRIGCLNGAAQDAFWDPSGADASLTFCKLLTDGTEKSSCYATIFGRASEILGSPGELGAFCEKAESSYQALCRTRIAP